MDGIKCMFTGKGVFGIDPLNDSELRLTLSKGKKFNCMCMRLVKLINFPSIILN